MHPDQAGINYIPEAQDEYWNPHRKAVATATNVMSNTQR